MNISLSGLVNIIGLEGICLSPYLDSVGVVTIGIGTTKTEIPDLNLSHPDITMDDAIFFLKKSITKYTDPINDALKVQITQYQFDALTSWCYNVGVGAMKKSSLIRDINLKADYKTIYNDFMKWNKPKEIIGRRTKEAKLYTTGVYSEDGKALLFPVGAGHKPIYSKGKLINVFDVLKLYKLC